MLKVSCALLPHCAACEHLNVNCVVLLHGAVNGAEAGELTCDEYQKFLMSCVACVHDAECEWSTREAAYASCSE